MLLPPDVLVRTDAELTRVWHRLRGRLRFTESQLWLLRIDPDGHPVGLIALADLPDGPYRVRADEVEDLVAELVVGESVAILYGRPGSPPWHLDDRAWGRFLARLAIGVRRWPVHRACDGILEQNQHHAGDEA